MKSKLETIHNKPLPYYTTEHIYGERQLAKDLRSEIVPKLARRLSGHHLNGLRHNYIVNFVQKNKKSYPYFLKTDIKKFYPSIRHIDAVTGFQVAYRDLLNMKYVPKAFKKKYVGPVNEWTKLLPLTQGLPLGSALSAILAPAMLVPLWLEIKRHWQVPMVIYMDDVLILARSQEEINAIYTYIENELVRTFNLYLNFEKTQAGRISTTAIEFCGWRFAGGYATISEAKTEAFKQRIQQELRACARSPLPAVIKRLNYKIDGFGHHYKYGNVGRTYELLDAYLRNAVRRFLQKRTDVNAKTVRNEDIERMGLRSLAALYRKAQPQAESAQRRDVTPPAPKAMAKDRNIALFLEHYMEKQLELTERLLRQNGEMLRIQRKALRLCESINI